MRKVATLLVLVACGAWVPGSAGVSGKAGIRLTDRNPLTVRGEHFQSRELVRVTVSAPATARKTVRTSATGSLRALFSGTTAHRCDLVRVVATGDEGSRAVLKLLPPPACAPS